MERRLAATGEWDEACDRRGVYAMGHPYTAAGPGNPCELTRAVILPQDLPVGGRVFLRFYSTDGCVRDGPITGPLVAAGSVGEVQILADTAEIRIL
jgi:hypothetical protein